MSFKTKAYVHSLKDRKTDTNVAAEVTIIEHKTDNDVIAEYNGIRCKAIFNGFVCMYYVDDIYGIIGRKTDCLYCHEEFIFKDDDIDDMGWVSCPKCEGKHETKGFI
jgi:DNA-directed RNA polymerase subunit RPC12/RpoP